MRRSPIFLSGTIIRRAAFFPGDSEQIVMARRGPLGPSAEAGWRTSEGRRPESESKSFICEPHPGGTGSNLFKWDFLDVL